MWTAWDYLGETGIGAWSSEKGAGVFSKPFPWILADTGAFDINGNPNGEAFLAKSVWSNESYTQLAVRPLNHNREKLYKSSWRGTNSIPSWSWKGMEGAKAQVEVFFNADFAELFLNGKPIGKKKVKDYKASFSVKYVSCELKAISYYKNGNKCFESMLCSAKNNLHISIKPEEQTVNKDFVVYVQITLCDESGVIESNVPQRMRITVESGTLIWFGSSNPRTTDRYDSKECSLYYGKAMAIIKTDKSDLLKIYS